MSEIYQGEITIDGRTLPCSIRFAPLLPKEPLGVVVARAGLYEVGLYEMAKRVHPNRIGNPSAHSADQALSVRWQVSKAMLLGHLAEGHNAIQVPDGNEIGIHCADCYERSTKRHEAGDRTDEWAHYVHEANGKRWPDEHPTHGKKKDDE